MKQKNPLKNAYVSRDLSWLYFNNRILKQAMNPDIPLLERLTFLGIYSNNLDEFYRVRVATHRRIAECSSTALSKEKEEAAKLLKQIYRLVDEYGKSCEEATEAVFKGLQEENIYILKENQLDEQQDKFIKDYYFQKLNGLVCPVFLHLAKEIGYDSDDNIYMALKMKRTDKKKVEYAYFSLPVKECGRFLRLPDSEKGASLMFIDDVARYCIDLIFAGFPVTDIQAYSFKYTKDAEMEIDNDLRSGFMQKISKGVKSRKKGEALRLIYDKDMPKDVLKKLIDKLGVDRKNNAHAGGRYHNMKDLMGFPDCGRQDLKFPKWQPVLRPELLSKKSFIDNIRLKDRFIHVPYHHFDYFLRLLQEASISHEVTGIQMTLYRLAKDSKVIKALITAAKNGKKVVVVIELLARFDEVSNIDWSKKMQDAGIKVLFGVEGLKIHSKLLLIKMKRGNNLTCVSTGNFHEGNAKVYTDYLLMTAQPSIVKDVEKVFNFVEKPYSMVHFNELLVSPNSMKKKFIQLIKNEIKNKKAGKTAYIRIKINHITDEDMIEALYEASSCGVKIDLLIRGNCSLVTGIRGVTDNITIHGIIDRYLEHSRIFIFAAGGENLTFLGSADWMPRNLVNRIEVITPVYDENIKKDLWEVVDYGLRDNVSSFVADGTGRNLRAGKADAPLFRSQEELYNKYLKNDADNEFGGH